MKYNIVSIDPSLISTALVINGKNGLKLFNYCRESAAYNKSGLSKWFKFCENEIILRFIEHRKYTNYSDGELIKLADYDKITSMIIKDIEDNIDKSLPTKIGTEGYSFSSASGDLIDLVTFSTILRMKLFNISQDILIVSPSTLKMEACKLTYPPINEGVRKEKWVYKNNDGVSGGSLTKHGIFLCIVENETFTDKWAKLCKSLKTDVIESSKVAKPIEDIDDAYILYRYLDKFNN